MSQQSLPILTFTDIATTAIAANTFVGWTGATAAAGDKVKGVSRSDAAIGQPFPTDVLGTSIVIAGAAFAAGDALEVGTAGAAIKNAGTNPVVGHALQAANGAGDLIEVFILSA